MNKQEKHSETLKINNSKSKFAKNIIWILSCLIIMLMLSSLFIYKDLTHKTSIIPQNIIPSHSEAIKPSTASSNSIHVISNHIPAAPVNATSINQEQSCKALLSFVRNYHHMIIQIYRGKDFSDALFELKQFKIANEDITQGLDNLSGLAALNVENEYFRNKFSGLSKNLYQTKEADHSFYKNFEYYLKKLFFIKPIGDRAKHSSGLDKEIALTEEALKRNDFALALENSKNLPSSEELEDFKQKLQAKITITQLLSSIDDAIFNKLNCATIGQ